MKASEDTVVPQDPRRIQYIYIYNHIILYIYIYIYISQYISLLWNWRIVCCCRFWPFHLSLSGRLLMSPLPNQHFSATQDSSNRLHSPDEWPERTLLADAAVKFLGHHKIKMHKHKMKWSKHQTKLAHYHISMPWKKQRSFWASRGSPYWPSAFAIRWQTSWCLGSVSVCVLSAGRLLSGKLDSLLQWFPLAPVLTHQKGSKRPSNKTQTVDRRGNSATGLLLWLPANDKQVKCLSI